MIKKTIALLLLLFSFSPLALGGEAELYFSAVENYKSLASLMDVPEEKGMVVVDVNENGMAQGLVVGDVIVAIRVPGRDFNCDSPNTELFEKFKSLIQPGDKVEVSYIRRKSRLFGKGRNEKKSPSNPQLRFKVQESHMTALPVVMHQSGKLVHFDNYRHTPRGANAQRFDSARAAMAQGGKMCSLCLTRFQSDCSLPEREGQFFRSPLASSGKLAMQATPSDVLRQGQIQKIQDIGLELAKLSERPWVRWEFSLADSDMANAYSLPGGRIVITRAYMDILESDSEIAIALAHEIIHNNHFHLVEKLEDHQRNERTNDESLAKAVDKNPDTPYSLVQLVSLPRPAMSIDKMISILESKGYDKNQEHEADMEGIMLAKKLKWFDKDAGLRLFEKWEDMRLLKSKFHFASLVSTHPFTSGRLENAMGDNK